MKQRFYGISLLVTALAALALSGPAGAGQQAQAPVARKQVPFKGTASGVVTTVGFDPDAGIAYTHVAAEGQATNFGHFTVSAEVAVVVATGIPRGNWTLTADNGDQLFLAMGGHGIDATHGYGALTAVGGTGRFQGVTANYEDVATFSANPASSPSVTYTDVIQGTISAPGATQ